MKLLGAVALMAVLLVAVAMVPVAQRMLDSCRRSFNTCHRCLDQSGTLAACDSGIGLRCNYGNAGLPAAGDVLMAAASTWMGYLTRVAAAAQQAPAIFEPAVAADGDAPAAASGPRQGAGVCGTVPLPTQPEVAALVSCGLGPALVATVRQQLQVILEGRAVPAFWAAMGRCRAAAAAGDDAALEQHLLAGLQLQLQLPPEQRAAALALVPVVLLLQPSAVAAAMGRDWVAALAGVCGCLSRLSLGPAGEEAVVAAVSRHVEALLRRLALGVFDREHQHQHVNTTATGVTSSTAAAATTTGYNGGGGYNAGYNGGDYCGLAEPGTEARTLSEWRLRLSYLVFETLGRLRVSQMFDIVVDYPDSLPAVRDLAACLRHTNLQSLFVCAFKRALQQRLLHAGASATGIIHQYVATIKTMREIDPSGALLQAVAQPIREYLRGRADTIKCLVGMVTQNYGGLPLERLNHMLRLFVVSTPRYDKTPEQLQAFLQVLIAREVVVLESNGVYKWGRERGSEMSSLAAELQTALAQLAAEAAAISAEVREVWPSALSEGAAAGGGGGDGASGFGAVGGGGGVSMEQELEELEKMLARYPLASPHIKDRIREVHAALQESELVFFTEAEEAADRLVTELLRERAADELAERRAERARDEEVEGREAAAVAAAEEEARLARLERLRLLVAPQGFTTEQVLRDQRFKVREALTRLGLHETDYGRAAIAAARPAQPPRLDNYTSDQRAAMLAKQACK
eukprot:XP_001698597.1 cullin-related protein [Chlamydomonas reinhardtii]